VIPEEVYEECLGVLVLGSAAATGPLHGSAMGERLKKLDVMMNGIMHRHLSNSPNMLDKKEMIIEILDTALKIAKGEIEP
jgi:hypothetical protein